LSIGTQKHCSTLNTSHRTASISYLRGLKRWHPSSFKQWNH